ncbi:MAG TPA: LLM class flavin-dependent oxidoreductase [Ktedonobacteraceae bacterium]|nr:LLM class flavin-dependent oxidoreductase [Ktedonobacteraceae bacterium]
MQNNDTSSAGQTSAAKSARDRVGLLVNGMEAAQAVEGIKAAEAAGVRQVWMTQSTPAPDTLTIFAAAAVQTRAVNMGTAVVPIYPRNPLALAQQALALGDLAPGRLRLGVGPSHRPIMEGVYGIPMSAPLQHLREYVAVLREALWHGKVDYQGRFYSIHTTLARPPHPPILISALREGAFHLAGEIADGAISWVCPVPYLLEKALPALHAGAAKSGRPAPPLVAHIPVALSQNRQSVLAAARKRLGTYGHLPFYTSMFADAGFSASSDGTLSDALIDSLVVSGDEATVSARLKDLLSQGLDELLVMPIPVANAEDEQGRLARLIGQF